MTCFFIILMTFLVMNSLQPIARILPLHKIVRRQVVIALAVILGASILLALITGAPLAVSNLDPSQIRTLENGRLTELSSKNGILAVTLTAAPQKINLGTVTLDGFTYNGDYAGPVLRLRAGETLRVHLINHMNRATNIHFHGMRTTPLGNSDNIHVLVSPGNDFTYEILVPVTQPPGLYWYHSHLHGDSKAQVMGGLSGALIIDPPDGQSRVPENITQHLLVFKDMVLDDDTGDPIIDRQMHHIVQTINGALDTTIQSRPGETQLWHLINQSADKVVHLALQGHHFRIVGQDGDATVGSVTTDILDIPPAARYDVLVDAASPGSYIMAAKNILTGFGASRIADRPLGHFVVAGAPMQPVAALPSQTPPDLRAIPITGQRDIIFTQSHSLDPDTQQFFINSRRFAMDRVDVRVPLGAVEEWTIRNESDDIHVFHIHQLGFQVVAINGADVPYAGRIDTVRIPQRGSVTIIVPFTDPMIVGRFVFHCHVLTHEDHGMMAQVEVYDPRPPPMLHEARILYAHFWWWLHGVPWALCGLASA